MKGILEICIYILTNDIIYISHFSIIIDYSCFFFLNYVTGINTTKIPANFQLLPLIYDRNQIYFKRQVALKAGRRVKWDLS